MARQGYKWRRRNQGDEAPSDHVESFQASHQQEGLNNGSRHIYQRQTHSNIEYSNIYHQPSRRAAVQRGHRGYRYNQSWKFNHHSARNQRSQNEDHQRQYGQRPMYESRSRGKGRQRGRGRGHRGRDFSTRNRFNVSQSRNRGKYGMSIGPQPHGISHKSISYLSQYQYWATEKSDGLRLLCCVLNEKQVIFIDRKFDVHHVIQPDFGHLPMDTVLDGELVISRNNNIETDKYIVSGYSRRHIHQVPQSVERLIFEYIHIFSEHDQLTYLIFDCPVYGGKGISNMNSSIRFQHIDRFMNIYHEQQPMRGIGVSLNRCMINAEVALADIAVTNTPPFSTREFKDWFLELIHRDGYGNGNRFAVHQKQQFGHLEHDKCALKFAAKTRFPATKTGMKQLFDCIGVCDGHYWFTDPRTRIRNMNDGIVFTPENNSYFMKRDERNERVIRKWKPIELNTVDVMVRLNEVTLNSTVAMYAFDHESRQMVEFDRLPAEFAERILHLAFKPLRVACYSRRSQDRVDCIVECGYDQEHRKWGIVKIRRDKIRPNTLKTCLDVRKRILSPVLASDLIAACPDR